MRSLAQELRLGLKGMSRAERRIARALLSSNFEAGLMPVASLASAAGVSGPTVIRFTTELGYSTYRDFQQSAQHQVRESIKSPATGNKRGVARNAGRSTDDIVRNLLSRTKATLEMIDSVEFERVAKILGDRRRNLYTIGGQATSFFANLLAARLFQIRPAVRSVNAGLGGFSLEDQLPFISNRDVIFAFDFRRYQKSTIDFCRIVSEQGATIVLMTDVWLSPIADIASHVLVVDSETDGPYDFLTPCMALLDALQEQILVVANVDEMVERIRLCEKYPRGLVGEDSHEDASSTTGGADELM